jgi:hypothetical protein
MRYKRELFLDIVVYNSEVRKLDSIRVARVGSFLDASRRQRFSNG